MGERLLIQPGGAVGVIGYSRTTGTWNAQQDLVSLFRSLSEQNPNTLGEFLVGARLFRLSDLVTVRNLMLLGDPALNIRTRAPAPADTFDVAVGTSDIRTAWGSYAHSAGTIEVTVHNAWKTDVYDLEVELWRGEPGSEGSSLFGTEVIDTLRAYGPDVVTFSVSGLEGNVRLYVVLDPDDLIAERAEDNNIAFRDFLALPYEGAYPTRLQFNGAERSVTIADLASAPGKEVLVSGFTSTDRVLQCYAVGDTQAVWTYGTGSVLAHIKNQPVAGHLYKSASSYVAVEHGSSVRILNGQSGAVVKTRLVGDTRPVVNNWEAKWLLSDLGPDDPEMEFVTLRYIDGAFGDSLQVRAFSPRDTILFTHSVDVGLSVGAATAAIGDLDMDGSKEIVILQTHANTGPGSPAAGNELTVLSYATGGLTQKWQKDLAEGTITDPAIVLIDKGGDGTLSVLCNGAYPGPILRLYSASGSLEWTLSDLAFGYPVHFAAGDVDGDQNADVVVLDHQRVRLVSSANGSVLDTRTTPGDPVAPPLLIDLDADGTLEIVVVFEEQDPNIHFYPPNEAPFWTHVVILDANLDLFQPEWTFRTRKSSSSSSLPAIDDVDDDGAYEMVYVSPDQYLHVFELGSAAGEAAWSQRFANALNTGLNEQPIIGDGYTNPVSLYQRTRMLGHVTLDSTAAPSLYVGHGTEIRVDASVSDPFQLRVFGSVRMKGSANAPVVLRSNPSASGSATWAGLQVDNRVASANSPDTLSFVELSDASVGIATRSPLVVISSTVSNTFETGIDARGGAVLLLSNSSIEDCVQYGVTVFDEARLHATNTAFTGNEYGAILTKLTGSWVSATIRDCLFTNNAHGMWLGNTGDSTVVIEGGTFEDNSGTGIYTQEANVVVDGTTIRGGELGINATTRTSLSLSNATIEDASLFGVSVRDSWLDATGTSFDGNDVGLDLETIPCVDPDPPCAYSWVMATVRDCSFTGNGDGVWVENVYDSSVVIDNCLIDNSTTNGVYVEGPGDVAITRNTITNNVIGVYSYESNPMIRSCNSIHYNTGGVKCDNFSTAAVESSTVTNNTNGIAVVNDANPDLGHQSGGSSLGYNILRPNTSFILSNLTGNTVVMENNHLARNPPSQCGAATTKIYGYVDYDPHLGCDLPDLCNPSNMPVLAGAAEVRLPVKFRLRQNYPNPFNPTTTIAYEVPRPGSRVEIALYDVAGRRVAILVNEDKVPGSYSLSWDGRNREGVPVASGVYFLRMRAGEFVETKKLLLLK